MLKDSSDRFLWKYETRMFGGNAQWANPEEAERVGETVGEELLGRFEDKNIGSDHYSPYSRRSSKSSRST